MGKYRVFEIAKEFETSSKVIIDILSRNDIHVKNHMSSIEDGDRNIVAKTFERKADKPSAKPIANPAVGSHTSHAKGSNEKPVSENAQQLPPKKVNEDQTRRQHDSARASAPSRQVPQQQKSSQQFVVGGGDNRVHNQTQRPQHSASRPAPAQGAVRKDYTQGGSSPGYKPQQRPQNAQRPITPASSARPAYAGSGTNPRPQHAQGTANRQPYQGSQPAKSNAPGQERPASARPSTQAKPAARPQSTDFARKTTNKNRPESKTPIQGSYATKGSRPAHSKTHMGRSNKRMGSSGQQVVTPKVYEVVKPTHVEIGETINVKTFADLIKREVSEVIKHLFMLGVMVTINQNIDFETAVLVGSEFGVEVTALPPEEDPTEIPEVEDDPAKRVSRPPVITVMGHVDHGKTSLLDAIRKTHVTAREAGGITQHIGAYQVNYQGKRIVFLDTPGHEAFTAMRARGAQVTDVAILVVAADDGVMPQTVEAINHAKAAKVPIIVAINKMDREGANPDHVKQQLAELELIPEDWGGETIMVPVSAHKKTGISELLEMILLVAEMQDLKANPDIPAHGTIIEAQLDKGRGPVATVLIEKGTLRIGDTIIAGTSYGKVRAMINDRGEKVKKATPSTPVEVLGLNDVPMAGDILDATEEKIARSVAEKRIAKKKTEEIQQHTKVSLDDIFQRIQEGELKELNIVVKADVQGTIEALKQSLTNIKNEEVKVVIVHAGVGTINESDVMLASAANALIIGFNVRPDANARKAAESEKVDIRTYRVIYDALNDVEAAIKGMLAPKFKEVIQGRAEVRQVITISKMLIAGCYVLDGKITSSSKIRLIRDGIVVHEGEIESLRRFKDDVREVATGFECGITLEKYREVKEGDIFEAYTMEEIKA